MSIDLSSEEVSHFHDCGIGNSYTLDSVLC